MGKYTIVAMSLCVSLLITYPFFSAQSDEVMGEAGVFSFEAFTRSVEEAAKNVNVREDGFPALPEWLLSLTYDQHRAIRFKSEDALWRDNKLGYELQAFHPGWLFQTPVSVYEVVNGVVVPLQFSTSQFTYGSFFKPEITQGFELSGVAGFRLHYPINRIGYKDELISFLGASYFRALGRGSAYGLSARGLAVNTATGKPEEFPTFRRFYVERPLTKESSIRVWAELVSESVRGAYEFVIEPGATTQVNVIARLFIIKPIERLGIAPLTSMYLHGENDRRRVDDFRPEVHDSDGLSLQLGSGENLWRPLTNPEKLQLSFIGAENPKSFGLLQRDRDREHYQDLEAHYERRPSLVIEPKSDWGEGEVVLAEIPSDKETNDNIVAFWTPKKPVKPGDFLEYHYSMRWGDEEPLLPDLGKVLQTRTGKAGHAARDANPYHRKFVVDFVAQNLSSLSYAEEVKPQVTMLNGEVDTVLVTRINQQRWRAFLDVTRNDLSVPVELKLKLKARDTSLSETWLYQWGE
ncbi:glucan biosynthesis protein [Flexibacterium corallicola]|uniref:glucan biosynthesis protein n=1 Tax=Flexibacterium corallicola TaxID=3037259 RepID=UPI00286F51E0|nr:glucan biosynthesis protein [Pseudovibrio sp. M1P-2-3]